MSVATLLRWWTFSGAVMKKCSSYQHYATWGHGIRRIAIQKLNHLASCALFRWKAQKSSCLHRCVKVIVLGIFVAAIVKLPQFVISKPDEVCHRRGRKAVIFMKNRQTTSPTVIVNALQTLKEFGCTTPSGGFRSWKKRAMTSELGPKAENFLISCAKFPLLNVFSIFMPCSHTPSKSNVAAMVIAYQCDWKRHGHLGSANAVHVSSRREDDGSHIECC